MQMTTASIPGMNATTTTSVGTGVMSETAVRIQDVKHVIDKNYPSGVCIGRYLQTT